MVGLAVRSASITLTNCFAPPSGKVELASSLLSDLGFDPLPYHRDAPPPNDDYPYRVFTGVREDPFFQTGQRDVQVLRRRSPAPKIFLHPDDAARDGLADGSWVIVEREKTGEFDDAVAIYSSVLARAKDQFDVTGNLSIRGVTKTIVLPVTYLGSAKDPWGNEKLAFEGETVIDRKEFGLHWNAALEAGGFLVGDDVKIALQIQAA